MKRRHLSLVLVGLVFALSGALMLGHMGIHDTLASSTVKVSR